MLLFICHAHEDKNDFVRPLAEMLRRDYDVWYDEYKLTLGDSLLQKINEGLGSCDFGIVVFSPAFFALSKKWTRTELGGLFALEGTTRKIILPIRKDLTVDDLTKLIPTMGDRISVSASDGLERVVEEIRLAVDVSERKRQLTVLESAKQQIQKLDQTLKEQRESKRLLQCQEGVDLIRKAFQELFDALRGALGEVAATSDVLKFTFKQPRGDIISIEALYRINLVIDFRGLYANEAVDAQLRAGFFVFPRAYSEEQREELSEFEFRPSFRLPKTVVWIGESEDQKFGTEELAAKLIEQLIKEIEARSNPS